MRILFKLFFTFDLHFKLKLIVVFLLLAQFFFHPFFYVQHFTIRSFFLHCRTTHIFFQLKSPFSFIIIAFENIHKLINKFI